MPQKFAVTDENGSFAQNTARLAIDIYLCEPWPHGGLPDRQDYENEPDLRAEQP